MLHFPPSVGPGVPARHLPGSLGRAAALLSWWQRAGSVPPGAHSADHLILFPTAHQCLASEMKCIRPTHYSMHTVPSPTS